MDDLLEANELVSRKVARHLFAVFTRSDEDVPVEGGIAVQKRDRETVVVDDVMSKLRIARQELTDEAAALEVIS
jgi:hypothetical protein